VQVCYLGPLEVRDGERLVAVPGARLQRLLVALALTPGRWVPAGTLAEAVWGEESPADRANSLQSLVSRLRRALGRPELVEQSAAGYRLAIDPEAVDAVRLERLLAESRQLTARGETAAARTVLDEAAALWRGAPLVGDDSPEAAGRRAALDDLRLDVVLEQAGLLVREGRPAEAVPLLEELAATAPLREDVAGELIGALAAAGRPAEALATYERIRGALAEALGTDPAPALRARHLELLRLADRPAEVPTNLRTAVTSFVGREEDVAGVERRLAAGRLITVVGAGGSGKTRLATEVAARFVTAQPPPAPDGVWMVELASVTEPTAVWQAILDGLGRRDVAIPDPVNDFQRRDARERLLDWLRSAHCLLVVDNCEHLVDAVAALVAEILGRCPGVRVLATSREPLAIEGEGLHPLGPLAVPQEGTPLAEAAGNAAVRLLLDRARAVAPDVALDDAVVEIVRRLDGLPLAIELAAARLRVLSPAEVAERLADRFRLLTGGRRTATPRHRTLRAVVEWSWDLLSPLEREVAEHFSVFASGATEAAVAAVAPSWRDGTAPEELSDVLHALVDKSLLTAARTADGTRFRMLETLREYGAERLAELGLITAARTGHARWFQSLTRAQDVRLRGPEQLAALRVLDTERDDILAALRFLGEAEDARAAVDLVVDLGWYWVLRESGEEAIRWTSFALAVPGAGQTPNSVLAEGLQRLLGFAAGSDPAELRDQRAAFTALADRLEGVAHVHPAVMIMRPLMLFMGEEVARADAVLAEALADDDPWVRAAGRLARLTYAENEGDVASMRRDVDAGVAEWEAIGDVWGLAALLSIRGQVRTVDGDLRGAAEDFERARDCIRSLGGQSTDDVLVTMRLADLRLRAHDLDGARRHLETLRAQPTFGTGELLHGVLVAATAGSIAVAAGDDDGVAAAHAALTGLLTTLQQSGLVDVHSAAIGRSSAAALALRLGLVADAGAHLRVGYEKALLTRDKPILASVGMSVALLARALGRPREAAVLLGASVRLRGAEDSTSPVVVDLVASLREALGEEYDRAYAEGRALDVDAATARIDPEGVQAVAAR
jgi:predicted ATPase/DNA-binding SARP family transcriptional activator